MELTNIASILNSKVIQNALGKEVTIAEDLSNIVDFGTALEDLSEQNLLSVNKAFVAGILKTEYDGRLVPESGLDIVTTELEYNGVIQSIKAIGLRNAVESPVGKLVDDGQTSYLDGRYHGTAMDVKVYDKSTSFRIQFSLPGLEHVKQNFTSIEGVNGYIATIKANYENSRRTELYQLEKRILCSLIVNCKNGNREVKLLTMWNAGHTDHQLTATTCLEDAQFLRWAGEKWNRVQGLMREINKKYNDSSVVCFTPSSMIKAVMLDEFNNAINFNMLADTRNLDKVSLGVKSSTLPFWQNAGEDLIPSLGVTSEVKSTDGATEDETIVTVSNVVGIIYDNMAAKAYVTPLPLAQEIVGAGRFINYYDDEIGKRLVDSRNAAVIFTLN